MSALEPRLEAEAVRQQALALGFHKVGIAVVDPAPSGPEQASQAALNRWLNQGHQADMAWMNSPKRQDIRQVLPGVRSVIAVALNYYTPHQRPLGAEYGKISRYGWGRDYHRILHRKLKLLQRWLVEQGADADNPITARYYADTGPVSDKFWAQQAGLGWIGKNGNVITREYGSWVFLGEVLTNAAIAPQAADTPHADHCGTCTRCLTACPTAAITAPAVVDANRCIAYHTIENRADHLPPAIAQNLNGWVAGCDICQDVCPWNQRFAQPTDVADFQPYPDNLAPKLSDLATLSEAAWEQRFPASALRRIKPAMMRRNAQAAIDGSNSDLEVNL